jgi:two-component system OmpR family response regulator
MPPLRSYGRPPSGRPFVFPGNTDPFHTGTQVSVVSIGYQRVLFPTSDADVRRPEYQNARTTVLLKQLMRILVIEDDPTVGQYVKRGLEEHRWAVDLVSDGELGERRASSEAYDLVILDMRLPGKSGMEVLHALRAKGFERPVLVLTAQDAVDAKVTTLRAGADDYVTKPFAFEELLARVEALSRRPRALASPALRVRDLEIQRDTREVRRGGELIELTPKEYTVLEYLMRHQGRVMSRTLITEYAWGYHFDPGTNIVDVVINHLRKKIDAKHDRKLIHTVRGVGYSIRE